MELVALLGVFVAVDLLAYFFGHDSRDGLDHHQEALTALRRDDISTYRAALKELEREASRVSAVRF